MNGETGRKTFLRLTWAGQDGDRHYGGWIFNDPEGDSERFLDEMVRRNNARPGSHLRYSIQRASGRGLS